jgi:RNA polymerase sigma-70 factor (ECF subfamily)
MDSSSFNPEADQTLVKRFVEKRDEETFREIYRRHTPALYRLAVRLLAGSEADAAEAVQETWIRACRLLATFEWRSSLRTWLTGILINCVRELSRGSNHNESLPDELAGPPADEPTERMDLERAIAQLPPGYRHVLVLHDIEGYTHEQISAQLGITSGTSKSQLFHARRALRAMFTFD